MIRYTSSKQLSLGDFALPFGGELDSENRWVKWSEATPWDELAVCYYKTMSKDRGRPGKDARVVIGALIIKHKLNLTDEETVLQIQESPYLQYFIGFSRFKNESPFAPSLLVEVRKRMGQEVFASFEQVVLDAIGIGSSKEQVTHEGKLLVDATVAEQAIRYPTDLSLLNEAREISELLVDELYKLSEYERKPRTYRLKARRMFLKAVKNKRQGGKQRRRCIREQLQFIRRNLNHISQLLDDVVCPPFPLVPKLQRQYWIIQHLYDQQSGMYHDKKKRCDDRVVSISQPHVRPIVRGKASKSTEFGSKLNVSMKDGLAFVDTISWDAFNESGDLEKQVEGYRSRYGCYPEVVLGDQLYGTRSNREFLKEKGIRYGGKPLGRPPKESPENIEKIKQLKAQRIIDSRERIPIEGKFGQGKNGYRLNYIRAKRQDTSEAWIRCIFFVMNLKELWNKEEKNIKKLFSLVISFIHRLYFHCKAATPQFMQPRNLCRLAA